MEKRQREVTASRADQSLNVQFLPVPTFPTRLSPFFVLAASPAPNLDAPAKGKCFADGRRSHIRRLYLSFGRDKVASGRPWCFTVIQEFCLTDTNVDENTTRATARLPTWRLTSFTTSHPVGEFEQISINLRATPSFDEFGEFLGTANPFLIWAQVAQMAWLPWLGLARAFTPQMLDPPARRQLGSDEPKSREEDRSRRSIRRAKSGRRSKA